jgi:dephospho-CoA kinase
VEVEHVGSTAVPGLVAKDAIDLQVGVRALADADGADVVRRLGEAGFPRVGDVHEDHAKDGGTWPKRFHGGCDPGRVVHVHVRVVGSAGWRWALLFRDWLRADPAAREEYAAEKLRIAASGVGTSAYAEAKEPWFDAVHDRAETWAARTGWEAGADG